MSQLKPSVVAIVATMRRPAELSALLASLATLPEGLRAVVIVDNGRDDETRKVVDGSPVEAVYLRPEKNLGCGGGLLEAERWALENLGAFTHCWILDDDAVVEPDTLGELLAAMATTTAVCACPLVQDGAGLLNWCPGLLEPAKYRIANSPRPPEEYLRLCGDVPVRFSWSQGIALLVTREALLAYGLHRGDFWVRGEDLDFSLRLTWHATGVWVPAARVHHLPPAESRRPEVEYVRHAALLQNVAYVGVRLPHGRRIARTLPGNWLRFLRTWGWKPRAWGDVCFGFFTGAVLGWPAGRTYGKNA